MPCEERTQIVGYWLAKGLQACPGIRLHAVIQMSNHIHLEITDTRSETSEFMARFLGPLSKDINNLDNVRGQLFERRFTAIEVVDDRALAQRIAYTILNPVRAKLVRRHGDWTGLCLWSGNSSGPVTFQRFRRRAYERTCDLQRRKVDRAEFYSTATLEIFEGVDVTEVQRLIEEGETKASDQVMGMEAATRVSPFDHPKRPKRGRLPLCHASTPELWKSFLSGWRSFIRAYRAASQAYRAGDLATWFPDFTFRPSLPAT